MTCIVVDRVSFRYTRAVEAIRDVSLELPAGAILGLFGPNGAGKSTLLQCAAGLRTPSSGDVRVDGVSSAARALIVNGTLAFVSESIRLPGHMTLGALARWIAPLHPRWDSALVATLTERFQLDHSRRIATFSRGEYLKAALLCALASRPSVLILDEPFAGIEVAARDSVLRGLLSLASTSGTTVMLASHDVGEVASLLSHVAVLVHGQLRVFGTVDQVGERFLRITMSGGDGQLQALAQEQSWLSVERSGRMLRVVADRVRTPVDAAMLERRFVDATSIEVEPISLRDVVALFTSDASHRMRTRVPA